MTVWTMDQVRQVRGLGATVLLDAGMESQSQGQASEVAADKMARKLIDMAHPFAVEIHRDDLSIERESPASTPWTVRLTCRWQPTTNAAILMGGPRDGEKWAIQKVGDPLRVEVLGSTGWLDNSATSAESALSIYAMTYELTGWHEAERCWVYTPRV